ncbi:Peptidyl-prolyl cis-trans isomerase FKBP19, chloroplastic [Vitis vinifera]|uniref:peptidylprolyl isomerase n=1 Tax=Vitis vinifera TaxID=29760 RepID=A0A438H0Q8_VITVI|nr:Peptidyl-prolyl cis-trans isomerase FKBP19, chloroplastic [Vitis vinifera]
MASISKLVSPSPVSSYSVSGSLKSRSLQPKCLIDFHSRDVFNARVSSSRLSVRNDVVRGSLIVRCSQLEGNGSQIKRTTLHDLYEQGGQSPWYDNLCRPVTDLLPLIASGVRGVTSNPAIFQKAISSSNAYNEQFRELVLAGKDIESAYWELVVKDIQDACRLFEPIYDETDGGDGYVSVEVSPKLADDTVGTVEAAKWLYKVVDRPNVYIKIPATAPCVPSIKEVISLGISVNVTVILAIWVLVKLLISGKVVLRLWVVQLIFSLPRYEAVIDAYLDGLEASGLSDLSRVTSVASFFVSRVDTLIDKLLEKIGTPEALDLRGKAAVAQAALAYQLYQKKFSGPRWEALVKKGAKKQRLLWASTSVKNPAYPDTLYVSPLIGPDTVSLLILQPQLDLAVSTMPDQALQAFVDHGVVSRTIDSNVSEAEGIYSALEKLGIDWGYVGSQLELEGVESFKKSFDSLLDSLQEKANSLKLIIKVGTRLKTANTENPWVSSDFSEDDNSPPHSLSYSDSGVVVGNQMASISAIEGFLPNSLAISLGKASKSRWHMKIPRSNGGSSQELPRFSYSIDVSGGMGCRPVFGRREAAMLSIGLLAGAIWNASENEVAVASEFTDSNFLCPSFGSVRIMEMPALRGKDYGKTKMRFPDYTETASGLQYKDLRVGSGPSPKVGETVVVDWDGYTIGYYGRIFEARNKTKGGSFQGDDKDFFKFRVGSQQVIPAFEEAVSGMSLGSIRRIIVPPELGYPENDFNKSGPRPTTFSGQRALDFVLRNQGLIDKTLLFDIELLKIIPN